MSTETIGYRIGDIVTTKAHPYFEKTHTPIISGDALLIPPLLVISEIVVNGKDEYDEKTGFKTTSKGSLQCKCIWYSNKSGKFEEEWISSANLKLIVPNDSEEHKKISSNDQVVLKTLDLELGKRKSSLTLDINAATTRSTSAVTALLSFVSPVLYVVEVKKNEKSKTYDPKYGHPKHLYPEYLAKCKWFNPLTDKFSEISLPNQAIEILQLTDENTLQKCQQLIEGKVLLKYKAENIILLKQILFRSGKYYIKYYDYISNSIEEKSIHIINDCTPLTTPVIALFSKGSATLESKNEIKNIVNRAIPKKHYIRIKYKDRNDNVTVRTISNYTIVNDVSGNPEYLSGNCHLRNSERSFNMGRIQLIEELDLSYN